MSIRLKSYWPFVNGYNIIMTHKQQLSMEDIESMLNVMGSIIKVSVPKHVEPIL